MPSMAYQLVDVLKSHSGCIDHCRPSSTCTYIFKSHMSILKHRAAHKPGIYQQLSRDAALLFRFQQEFVQDIHNAVEMLRSLRWEDIRVERFSHTPPELFGNLVRTAEYQMMRHKTTSERCQAWLAEAKDDPAESDKEDAFESHVPASTCDKYGIDLDVFKQKIGRKPQQWTLLDCFCDDQYKEPHKNPRLIPLTHLSTRTFPSKGLCMSLLLSLVHAYRFRKYCIGRRHAR